MSVVVCVFGDDVPRHGRMPHEPGRTEGAAEWPLSRVSPDVVSEVLSCYEPGRAHMALVAFHIIVGFHM